MNDFELEAELAAANPIDERAVASTIPPAVGEAMLREIVEDGRPSAVQRLTYSLGGLGGRGAFVGVLAIVVLAVSALNFVPFGGSATEDAVGSAGSGIQAQVDGECRASGAKLDEARRAYGQACQQTRLDCDPIDDGWLCSSHQLGDSRPNLSPESNDRDAIVVAPTSTAVPAEADTSIPADDGGNSVAPSTTVASAPAPVCTASGDSVGAAMAAYDQICDAPRSDCDPLDGQWVCSSAAIGVGSPATGDGATTPTTASPSDPNLNPAPTLTSGSDCFTIEAESMNLVGAWKQNSDGGASGGTYITWEGLSKERNNSTPTDIIEATISVANPGTYRFVWAMRQPGDVAGDKANDSWLNFPDASRFGPTGGGSYGGFVKVFGNSKGNFGWAAKADQHEAKSDLAIEFSAAGSYKMQVAGRSHGHQIDKVVIYRDGISRDDAINDRCAGHTLTAAPAASATVAPSQSSNPSPNPGLAGPFDPSKDLISLHYDHAPDRDDGHATVAGKVVVDTLGIKPWVIGGAYGTNKNTYQSDSEAVMRATWGTEWVNAHADWSSAVAATADRWQRTLNNGGSIWVAEGGQSDLTADVVRELKRRDNALATTSRIHVVQHSNWNEDKTTSSDLSYVRTNTDYIRLEDGNNANQTANLNQVTAGWESRARSSRWGDAWSAAFNYLDPDRRLDFSDTVELLHIVGIEKNEVATTNDFADRFFG